MNTCFSLSKFEFKLVLLLNYEFASYIYISIKPKIYYAYYYGVNSELFIFNY